jgi:hypothetical protein
MLNVSKVDRVERATTEVVRNLVEAELQCARDMSH